MRPYWVDLVGAQADNTACKLQTRTIYEAGVKKKGASGELTIGILVLVGVVERVDLST